MIEIAQAAGVIEDAIPISKVLSNILDFLLSVAGIVGILGLVVSGIFYLVARGDEELAKRAKMAMTYSLVGIAVVAGALVVVGQIARFFQ
jgi:cytochrome bd-type quinol oxidase subunit 2